MGKRDEAVAERFEQYLSKLHEAIGHADRREPLRAYLTGVLLPGRRKSVEPMAARIDPRHVSARHQSMHHFVATADWNERALLRVATDFARKRLSKQGPIRAWIVDDTGIPKKGRHSVGVARQYCGVLGKQDNCQVAVSVSLAADRFSLPAAYRLYLPKQWAEDPDRRRRAGIPEQVGFAPKWRIALDLLEELLADGLEARPVVADAGYGDTTAFRQGLQTLGLTYAVGVKMGTHVWAPGKGPLPPRRWSGKGRPPKLLRRDRTHRPVSIATLARSLPGQAWRRVVWREGTKGTMRSRFARVRVRAAHRDYWRSEPHEEQWLLLEWPGGEPEPTKAWLSNVPERTGLAKLVELVKLRWRIERDYQELKDELGLDHYEGRGWRGFHHHGALCMAAYCFLAAERGRLSPPRLEGILEVPAPPKGFRPRGGSAAGASRTP